MSADDYAFDSATTPTSTATSTELANELPSRIFDDFSIIIGIQSCSYSRKIVGFLLVHAERRGAQTVEGAEKGSVWLRE